RWRRRSPSWSARGSPTACCSSPTRGCGSMRDRAVGRVAGLRAAGGVMLVAVVAFALVWPAIAPADMASSGYLSADLPPTWAHPMGTDGLGHDLSVRVAQALRVSLAVAAGAAVLAGVLGVAV